MSRLDDIEYLNQLVGFIEDATQDYNSCLIVSPKNKCCSVVVAMVYLMIKFKWNVIKCLEYMNARKADIELPVSIIKDLKAL